MEKTKANSIELSDKDVLDLKYAGLAQCGLILLQSFFFPQLGIIGALIASLCAMMPWLIGVIKINPARAFGMTLSSLVLTPFYSTFCLYVINTFGSSL